MIRMDSPVGPLLIRSSAHGVTEVSFVGLSHRRWKEIADGAPAAAMRHASACAAQIGEYFAGERRRFGVPLDLPGRSTASPFRRRIWLAMQAIPFGETISYRDLAERVGHMGAYRAAGGACNANPLPILIPCHRIIGSGGDLTGYAGGLARKRWLLEHEAGVKMRDSGGSL